MPMRKYIGTSTNSKRMKKSTRSRATKVPVMPVASSSMSARKAFGLCGSGQWFHE